MKATPDVVALEPADFVLVALLAFVILYLLPRHLLHYASPRPPPATPPARPAPPTSPPTTGMRTRSSARRTGGAE